MKCKVFSGGLCLGGGLVLGGRSRDSEGLRPQHLMAMSNTPVLADNSGPFELRRAKVRQPMGALAYLDIGPDNGGILLNLSEDGLALQAVAPLHGQKEVQLAIQLPHSETRIEAAAEIVWLGATSRQA